jgi:UDPglucose 6-dehydrogenase
MSDAPKICIVGLQHQGVVQAACFSEIGYQVVAIDGDAGCVAALNSGHYSGAIPEPGLETLLRNNLLLRRLRFTTDNEAVSEADFVFLSIDLPFNEKGLLLESTLVTASKIEELRSAGSILCVTSQVPVGTTESLTSGMVAYVPELLRPGQSVSNFLYADRIIIGADDPAVLERVVSLYRPLGRPVLQMGLRSAEMAKHAHNTMLATQISFANEIANLCKKVGADEMDVARATKADSRVGGKSYVNPGWGLSGGHLIRDLHVLQELGRRYGCKTPLLDAVELVDKIRETSQ